MKYQLIAISLSTLLMAYTASAHDVWVTAKPMKDRIIAEIGYGHDFPAKGRLPNRQDYFVLPQITTEQGKKILESTGTDYVYEFNHKLKNADNFIISTNMKPMFWSKTKKGWRPLDKQQAPQASYCQFSVKFAKTIVSNGNIELDSYIFKPIGQELEIVPINNIFSKNEQIDLFQVFYRGKPLSQSRVEIDSAEYIKNIHNHDHSHGANSESAHPPHTAEYSLTTNDNGIISVKDLPAGEWMLLTKYKQPFENSEQCDENVAVATLSFKR
ncbi:TPA: DUF4198 domain-containing protein [Providencia rettgeri]